MKTLKISESLTKEILQYLFALFCAWLVSSLLMDFPFFSEPVKNSLFTRNFSQTLIGLTNVQIQILGFETWGIGNHLGITGTHGVIFAYGCLGFRYLLFFAVFVLFQFGKWYHKVWYILMGILLLTWINSIRAIIIMVTQYYNPTKTAIVHDVVTPLMMFPLILFLWLVWVRRIGRPPLNETILNYLLKKVIFSPIFRAK